MRAPENSLAAFMLAIDEGADGIECDVHLSRDGALVVIHDDTLDATTDGTGPVAEHTLAELRRFTLRHRKGDPVIGLQIPILAELLDLTTSPLFCFNVEIKPTRTTDLVSAVCQFINDHPRRDHILLSSFDTRALTYIHTHYPHLRRALLYPPTTRAGILNGLTRSTHWLRTAHQLGCTAVHPYARLCTPHVIQMAHQMGMQVNVWTVDDPSVASRLIALGADGIITNDPARLRATLFP